MWKWVVLLLFSGFVALEVALLLVVGAWLGVAWTLVWTLGSSIAGLAMVRVAGLHALVRIHVRLRNQELPTRELLDMALILAGAVLLVAPGLLSDVLGLLLLLSPARWAVRGLLRLIYGEFLPAPAFPLRPGAPLDEAIEVRAND